MTLDRRTIPAHFGEHLAAGRHSPGIIIVRRGAALSQVIDDLLLVLAASRAEEWQDLRVVLPL